jgi:hypothetical protein
MEKQKEEIFGYELERVNLKNGYGERVHFMLTGKRGAEYQLCEVGKCVYFVRNGNGNITGLKGNYTFSTSQEYIRSVGAGCFIPGKEEATK